MSGIGHKTVHSQYEIRHGLIKTGDCAVNSYNIFFYNSIICHLDYEIIKEIKKDKCPDGRVVQETNVLYIKTGQVKRHRFGTP